MNLKYNLKEENSTTTLESLVGTLNVGEMKLQNG